METEGYEGHTSNVLRTMGYFSLVGLLRVHCLLGEYELALQVSMCCATLMLHTASQCGQVDSSCAGGGAHHELLSHMCAGSMRCRALHCLLAFKAQQSCLMCFVGLVQGDTSLTQHLSHAVKCVPGKHVSNLLQSFGTQMQQAMPKHLFVRRLLVPFSLSRPATYSHPRWLEPTSRSSTMRASRTS